MTIVSSESSKFGLIFVSVADCASLFVHMTFLVIFLLERINCIDQLFTLPKKIPVWGVR